MPITPPNSGEVCQSGFVTRHDAFYSSVLQVFPNRAVPGVDGYFATRDCSMLGMRGILYLNGQQFDVVVADCTNQNHIKDSTLLWKGKYLGDVDRKNWIEAKAPNRPIEADICWQKNTPF